MENVLKDNLIPLCVCYKLIIFMFTELLHAPMQRIFWRLRRFQIHRMKRPMHSKHIKLSTQLLGIRMKNIYVWDTGQNVVVSRYYLKVLSRGFLSHKKFQDLISLKFRATGFFDYESFNTKLTNITLKMSLAFLNLSIWQLKCFAWYI